MTNHYKALVSALVMAVVAFGSFIAASAQTPDERQSTLTADEQKYKPRRPDLSLSGVEVLPVQGSVYLIATGKGSNIVAQVGDQGALLVDASVADVSDQVIAEIRKLTTGPIKGIVNTSTDLDHIGGNAKISMIGQPMFAGNIGYGPAPQATIFSHEKALEPDQRADRPDVVGAVGPVADRHVLRRQEEDLLQPRAD